MKLASIKLPNISATNQSTCQTEGNVPLNINKFQNLYKKYRIKNKVIITDRKKNDPNQLANDEQLLNDLEEEDKKDDIKNERYLVKIYETNHEKKFNKIRQELGILRDDVIIPKSTKRPKYGFAQFTKTNYSDQLCMKDFFNKYQQFNNLNRKEPIKKITPSFAFIKTSNDEKIVPNPLGLLTRKGEDYKLRMSYNKVGNNYMKALGQSLRYSEHLTELYLDGNRLTNEGTDSLFNNIITNKPLIYKIRTLDLSLNNIGKNNIQSFIQYLQDPKCNLENLNLFGNCLGDENIKILCDNLAKYGSYRMVLINLGKNLITDDCANVICNMIQSCSGLRLLFLNHNKLTNPGGTKIIKQLRQHRELRILDISWNNIGNNFNIEPSYEELVNNDLYHPERLFNNFAINETMTTMKLNLRRNPLLPSLDQKANKKQDKKDDKKKTQIKKLFTEPKKINEPQRNPTPFAIEMGGYFKELNLGLIHLDISNNSLSSIDASYLQKEIKDNHSILGIHVDGNEMKIDALGFLEPLTDNKDDLYFAQYQLKNDITDDYKLHKTNIANVRKLRSKNNCWICEGWREVKFTFIPKEPIEEIHNHLVKIHLNFDNYKPFDLLCLGGQKFEIVRMCPPGEIRYFFTIDTKPVTEEGEGSNNEYIKLKPQNEIECTFEGEYMEELNNIRERLMYQIRQERENAINEGREFDESKIEKSVTLTEPDKNEIIKVKVQYISKQIIKINRNVLNEDYRKNIKFTEPRPLKIINKFVKPRTPWTYPISIWAYYGYDYEGDSEEYLDQCFEFDFKRCQFEKDFKDEESYNELKLMLRKRYREIIDCYKYYASMSGFQVWQITQNNLTEFISHCPNLCDNRYVINDVFVTQKALVGNLIDKNDRKNGNKMLSDNIVRHQFMNLLVKVAKDKYVTVLKQTNALEAAKISFEQHWDPALKGFEYHNWRMERYYNEQVDNFLKAHLPLLDALYLSWAKQKGPRKKDVWMVLDEYNNLVQSFVDINDYPIRENPLYFNWSIRLQVNEIYSDKHINMFLPEFLEGLCRAVDKASPIPLGDNPEDWPKEKRVNQPLVNKLENILPVLIKLITHPDFKNLKEKFPMPQKDIATGLYEYNYDNPFYQGYIIKVSDNKRRQTVKRKTTRRMSRIVENLEKKKEETVEIPVEEPQLDKIKEEEVKNEEDEGKKLNLNLGEVDDDEKKEEENKENNENNNNENNNENQNENNKEENNNENTNENNNENNEEIKVDKKENEAIFMDEEEKDSGQPDAQ